MKPFTKIWLEANICVTGGAALGEQHANFWLEASTNIQQQIFLKKICILFSLTISQLRAEVKNFSKKVALPA